MNNKKISLIIAIIFLISLISNSVLSTTNPSKSNTPPRGAVLVSLFGASGVPPDFTEEEIFIVQNNPAALFKRDRTNKIFWIPNDPTNPRAGYTKYEQGAVTPGATSPAQASTLSFTVTTPTSSSAGPSFTSTSATGTNNMVEIEINARGVPIKRQVSPSTAEFLDLAKNNNKNIELILNDPDSAHPKYKVVDDAEPQQFDRFILADEITRTRTETIIDEDGNREISTTERAFEYDATKKEAIKNKPTSQIITHTKINADGKITEQTKDIFEPNSRKTNSADEFDKFDKKGSVTINIEHGENWFGGAFKSRTNTVIKDVSGATLYTIDKNGVIKDRNNAEVKPTSDNIKKIKAELGKIDDDLRQEFTDGVLESSAPFWSLNKFRAMDWSQFFGGFIKSYNEFAGLAHITNLAFDSDYEEKVAKRKIQNAQRFCALAGIGYCFVSNICDRKLDHIGSSVTLTQKGNEPSIGVARISGEKSPQITTPQGTQYLYTANFHLENPFYDQTMAYNVYFISSSGQEKKWYSSDKTLGKAEVVVVNQASDKPIRKLTKGNYDKVCIKFNPSIYIFGSRRTTSQSCDVLTKTPEEVSEDQVQSVVTQQGPDGDI